MKKVKDIVSHVLEKIQKEKTIGEDELCEVWRKVSGEKGYRHSKPISLHKQTLRVIVENPGWVQELTFNKRKILRGLQRRFGREKISDIRFKIGALKRIEIKESKTQDG